MNLQIKLAVAVATLAALLAGGSAGAAGQPDPKQMTLRLSGLPAGFAVSWKDTGRYDAARAARRDTVSAATYTAHGYISGYELDANRDGNLSDLISKTFEVMSSTSIYRDATGPRWSLARTVAAARKHHMQVLSTGGRIGAESHLYSYTTRKGGYTVRVYVLGWRDGRVKATIFVGGLKSGASPQDAVRLARMQERRIQAVMHS